MAIQFNKNGPLKYADLYKINEATFWDKTRPPAVDPASDDASYLVKIDDRIDLISSRNYGTADYGWIIMLRNNLRLFPNDFYPGLTIYLPTTTSLKDRGII